MKKLNFDGHGINGWDKYMSRIATFTEHGKKMELGNLFASAPDLLEACIEAHQQAEAGEILGIGKIELLRNAISKAKGGK